MSSNKTTIHRRAESTLVGRVPVFEVVAGVHRGTVFTLAQAQTIIGKSDVDIRLQDTGISRTHAKVVQTADGKVSIIDLASTNGVLVNGTQIDMAVLREGDRIQLGPSATLRLGYRALPKGDRASDLPKGEGELSPRQLEVARLVARGMTNSEIASELQLSVRTVASHLDNIYARLGIGSRAALTRWLVQSGLFESG